MSTQDTAGERIFLPLLAGSMAFSRVHKELRDLPVSRVLHRQLLDVTVSAGIGVKEGRGSGLEAR